MLPFDPTPILDTFHAEIQKFQQWSHSLAQPHAPPDYDYPDWGDLRLATNAVFAHIALNTWTPAMMDDILYVLARDNEDEQIRDDLLAYPMHALNLARYGVEYPDYQARWQLASTLGAIQGHTPEIEELLRAYITQDQHEYVRRRALFALLDRQSPETETLARVAWQTGDTTLKHWALWVLEQINSPRVAQLRQDAAE